MLLVASLYQMDTSIDLTLSGSSTPSHSQINTNNPQNSLLFIYRPTPLRQFTPEGNSFALSQQEIEELAIYDLTKGDPKNIISRLEAIESLSELEAITRSLDLLKDTIETTTNLSLSMAFAGVLVLEGAAVAPWLMEVRRCLGPSMG